MLRQNGLALGGSLTLFAWRAPILKAGGLSLDHVINVKSYVANEADLDPDFAEKFLAFIVTEVIRHHEKLQGKG